jgi:hypothetical protein
MQRGVLGGERPCRPVGDRGEPEEIDLLGGPAKGAADQCLTTARNRDQRSLPGLEPGAEEIDRGPDVFRVGRVDE